MPPWPLKPFGALAGTPPERALALLLKLGDPQKSLPPVIHVAGTNGKGSTIAFLRAMLQAAGYRVHAYTSPHLMRFNERIVLAGEEISDAALHDALERTRIAACALPVDVFDGTTAAALLAFASHPADVLLMETGMGGRFDATNVLTAPVMCILTSIAHDHGERLGSSLTEIAWHKAGILREGVPCVVSAQPEEALHAIKSEARKTDVPLYVHGEDWSVRESMSGFDFIDANGPLPLPKSALPGAHQYVNAGNAVAALSLLEMFDVQKPHLEAGLQKAQWPGRLERIVTGPLATLLKPGFELWYDGGHNPAGAQAIAQHAARQWHDKPLYLIAGTTRGKDLSGLLKPFAGVAAQAYGVPVAAEPNCYAGAEIAQALQQAGFAQTNEMDSARDALEQITAHHAPGRVLVFGSLFFRIELV